jgi:putative endonuclease
VIVKLKTILNKKMTGYMYILKCSNGSYYVGSTTNLELRIQQHQIGEGANYTKKHLPVELVYYEIYPRIDEAFAREKQIQGWRREKKEALINNKPDDLHLLAVCNNNTSHKNIGK